MPADMELEFRALGIRPQLLRRRPQSRGHTMSCDASDLSTCARPPSRCGRGSQCGGSSVGLEGCDEGRLGADLLGPGPLSINYECLENDEGCMNVYYVTG